MTHDSKLAEAFDFASRIHHTKTWKETSRSFLHHPMAVASLVMFYGGDSSQTIAALLHDTITETAIVDDIKKQFGSDVADLVSAFEDPPEVLQKKLEWAEIKKAYLKKIETLSSRSIFVIACEELHELSVLIHDAKYLGAAVWKRFPVPARDLGWYYKSLSTIFYHKLKEPQYQALVSEFATQTKVLSNQVFEGA
ncbi:MAG: HD domain-containing protein [Proteobacteria bacterium]|nr:HD domain-containing protein [Pseudomonadota bacterium]